MMFGQTVQNHSVQQPALLQQPSWLTHARSCRGFTTRRPWQRSSQQNRRCAPLCSATSDAGQAQESSKPAADAGSLFSDLSDACTELKRAPPSMVRIFGGTCDCIVCSCHFREIIEASVADKQSVQWRRASSLLHLQKYDASGDVLAAMKALKEAGALSKWGKLVEDGLTRRNVFLGDLKQVPL